MLLSSEISTALFIFLILKKEVKMNSVQPLCIISICSCEILFSLLQNKIMMSKSMENVDLRSATYNDKFFQQKPSSIPGLRVLENSSPGSNQSTPTSDESNSPTELNIYKRLLEKPPLIKRVPTCIKDLLHDSEGFPSTRPTPEGCLSFHKESSTTSPATKRRNKTGDVFSLR